MLLYLATVQVVACIRNNERLYRRGSVRGEANRDAVSTTDVQTLIRAIPDFPIPGILFRDITPLLKDAGGFKAMIDLFVDKYRDARIDCVIGIEARGYMIGAPLAYALGAGPVERRRISRASQFRNGSTVDFRHGDVLDVGRS